MSDAFLSEIKIVSFNYAPRGFATCGGQVLPIQQNLALFSLLGTVYGGNGSTTFALPNLVGRVPIHVSPTHPLGQPGGEIAHTLTGGEMATHFHWLQAASVSGDTPLPAGNKLADSPSHLYAKPGGTPTNLNPSSVSMVGGNGAHENMQPYLVLNMVICLQGTFPSRN